MKQGIWAHTQKENGPRKADRHSYNHASGDSKTIKYISYENVKPGE